jgi:hypothetical protein
MKECDAFIYASCSAYEPDAIYATRQWLEESGVRKLYTIGPSFPWPDTIFESSKHGQLATDHEVPENGTPVRAFMDRILASHGENSLLYVSHLLRPRHNPRIMLIMLLNVDVIRKYVVARERLREIVRRPPSRAGNPFREFLVLTSSKNFTDLQAYT